MESEVFFTIAAATEGIYKEKGSKFMAFAYPVNSEEEVKEKVELLRRKYFDARHHCYAYRLGATGGQYRAVDDSEPANSAGKPILGQLIAHDVTNVLVVVVRYFGGTLLGVGGLMQAYKQATADALSNAGIITGVVTGTYQISFGYPAMNQVLKVVKDMDLECYAQNFDLTCTMNVKVRKSLVEQLRKRLEHVEARIIE